MKVILIAMALVSPKTPCAEALYEPYKLKTFKTMEQCWNYRGYLEAIYGPQGYFCEARK